MEECFINILSLETMCHRLCQDTISCVKFIMYLSIVWVKYILLQYKSTEFTVVTNVIFGGVYLKDYTS